MIEIIKTWSIKEIKKFKKSYKTFKTMGLHNPFYSYELQIYKLQDKNLALFDQLDNAKIYIKQLEKKVNQLQKDSKQCH